MNSDVGHGKLKSEGGVSPPKQPIPTYFAPGRRTTMHVFNKLNKWHKWQAQNKLPRDVVRVLCVIMADYGGSCYVLCSSIVYSKLMSGMTSEHRL